MIINIQAECNYICVGQSQIKATEIDQKWDMQNKVFFFIGCTEE